MFGKIFGALKTGGKVAWKAYNSPEGQILASIFVPAKALKIVAAGVSTVDHIQAELKSEQKRKKARSIILKEFPEAAENQKMLNFMIEAKLQEMEGNLEFHG